MWSPEENDALRGAPHEAPDPDTAEAPTDDTLPLRLLSAVEVVQGISGSSIQLRGEIMRLQALADSEGTRAVQYLRRARKAEAALRALADAADNVGVAYFDTDMLALDVAAMKEAAMHARDVLGPNV